MIMQNMMQKILDSKQKKGAEPKKQEPKNNPSIQQYFYFYFIWFIVICKRIYFLLKIVLLGIENNQLKNDEMEKYIGDKEKKFISKTEKSSSNIPDFFYDLKKYKEYSQKEEIDLSWSRRIMIEPTPFNGQLTTIAMHYDPYKLGFSYYSDSEVPPSLLNALAMKYVLLFHCSDFFMDEKIYKSPLIEILKSELIDVPIQPNNKPALQSAEVLNPLLNIIKDNPDLFRGLKKLKNIVEDDVNELDDTNEPADEEKMKNKFIRLGKFQNFKILQPVNMNQKKYSLLFPEMNLVQLPNEKSWKKWKLTKKPHFDHDSLLLATDSSDFVHSKEGEQLFFPL
jgi:hypothetical protein